MESEFWMWDLSTVKFLFKIPSRELINTSIHSMAAGIWSHFMRCVRLIDTKMLVYWNYYVFKKL